MTPGRLRAFLQWGVLALVLWAPLPYGSVRPGAVLTIELAAAALGLGTLTLMGLDENAFAAAPKAPLAIGMGVIALGVFQLAPLPLSVAETFNPTADLVRPLAPFLDLDRQPAVSWSVAAVETTDALLRFVAYLLIGLAASVTFDTAQARRRLVLVIVAVAMFQAIYGCAEHLTGRQHIFAYAKKHYLDSATGTFINRNHFATVLAMALPFALVTAIPHPGLRTRRGWRERVAALSESETSVRLFAMSASATLWIGLLLSHSRAGLMAGLASACVVLVRFRRMGAARWATGLGLVILLVLLSAELAQAPGERMLSAMNDIGAKGGRLAVWRDTLGLVRLRPILGWGLGTFESVFPIVQSSEIEQHYDHAHNDWLEWTAEGGIVGLAAAFSLVALAVRRGWSGGGGAADRAFGVASAAAISATALHALWDFSLRIPAIALLGAVVLGVALRPTSEVSSAPVGVSNLMRRTG